MFMIGLIPARKGSKRLQGKNLKLLNGKPLLWWTLRAAEYSNLEKYYLTTDYEEFNFDLSEFTKLEIIRRPDRLCIDESPANEYIRHAIDYLVVRGVACTSICLLQPTCPLRTSEDINEAMAIYQGGSLPGLVSAYSIPKALLYTDRCTPLFRTDYDKDDIIYVRNSAVYIFDKLYFEIQGSIFVKPTQIYTMPMFDSVDINTRDDFDICQKLL